MALLRGWLGEGMETVASVTSPRGELVLRRRADGHLELRANGVFVMDTLEHTSEQALAERALAMTVAEPVDVLIGGLGLGYTLAAVLADERVGRCVVAEIEPDLVTWLRDGTVPHGPGLLADPRVEVEVGDVADVLRSAQQEYDVVLLDVDNGPGYLVHDGNADLYSAPLLAAARDALRGAGALVVWSAAEAPQLERAMRRAFGEAVEERHAAPAHGRVGDYFLYLARRRP
jgi:spermidine synthase